MPQRIFIAINFPEKIKEKIRAYQKEIDGLFPGQCPVRWVEKENIHITLVFLGYVQNEELPEIIEIVQKISEKYNSFPVSLNKIRYGPPKKIPPRMVWALGEKSEELGKLQKDLEDSLFSSPFKKLKEPETRVYNPHITLGRIRKWDFKKIEPEERPEIKKDISLSFEVNSIEIMESQLKRSGPRYTVLQSFPLNK
jgi:2'-5' RNA ligase